MSTPVVVARPRLSRIISVCTTFVFLSLPHLLRAQWTTSGSNVYTTNTVNVGIGTTTPQARLEVSGPALLMSGGSQFYFKEVTDVDRTKAGIRVNTGNPVLNAKNNGTLYLNRDVNSDTWIESAPDGVNNIEIAIFKANGNVGIGTTTPQAKLAVNGDVVAKKITVTQTGWPDYVFSRHYKLRSLAQVGQYIQQYQHLPDVPSADSVAKNGLDLGSGQAALLKKIEELTLYALEQQKLLEGQRERLEAQGERLEIQRQRLETQQVQLERLQKDNVKTAAMLKALGAARH